MELREKYNKLQNEVYYEFQKLAQKETIFSEGEEPIIDIIDEINGGIYSVEVLSIVGGIIRAKDMEDNNRVENYSVSDIANITCVINLIEDIRAKNSPKDLYLSL